MPASSYSGLDDERSNGDAPKNISAKATNDVACKKENGTVTDLSSNTNSAKIEVSSNIGQFRSTAQSDKNISDETSIPNDDSGKSYNTNSQENDPDELGDSQPSKIEKADINTNEGPNNKLLDTETNVFTGVGSDPAGIQNNGSMNCLSTQSDKEDTPKHINQNMVVSMDISTATPEGVDATIVENGVPEKPTLKYEYKPG